jgi:hypothetical protein
VKPDWASAPEWANFLSMDDDGAFWWWEYKPEKGYYNWHHTAGKFESAGGNDLEMFIERRPLVQTTSTVKTIEENVSFQSSLSSAVAATTP